MVEEEDIPTTQAPNINEYIRKKSKIGKSQISPEEQDEMQRLSMALDGVWREGKVLRSPDEAHYTHKLQIYIGVEARGRLRPHRAHTCTAGPHIHTQPARCCGR